MLPSPSARVSPVGLAPCPRRALLGGGSARGPWGGGAKGPAALWPWPWHFIPRPWRRASQIPGVRETSAPVRVSLVPSPFHSHLEGGGGLRSPCLPSSFPKVFQVPFLAWIILSVERVEFPYGI